MHRARQFILSWSLWPCFLVAATLLYGELLYAQSVTVIRQSLFELEYSDQFLPTGVSRDGAVMAGYIYQTQGQGSFTAWRWTTQSGLTLLPNLSGGQGLYATAQDISDDGTTIVGFSDPTSGPALWEAVRWRGPDRIESLGYLGSPGYESRAMAVSSDGRVVAGRAYYFDQYEAFRWDAVSGMVGLGFLPERPDYSAAADVSADGSVIVGTAYSYSPQVGYTYDWFRWTAAGGMQSIVQVPVGSINSGAASISADGRVVVGSSGGEPVRWTEAAGQMSLPTISVPNTSWLPTDVSDDGTVAVGRADRLKLGAIVWPTPSTVFSLKAMLARQGVRGIAHRLFLGADTVSTDGRFVVGHGRDVDSTPIVWRVELPFGPLPLDPVSDHHDMTTYVSSGSWEASITTPIIVENFQRPIGTIPVLGGKIRLNGFDIIAGPNHGNIGGVQDFEVGLDFQFRRFFRGDVHGSLENRPLTNTIAFDQDVTHFSADVHTLGLDESTPLIVKILDATFILPFGSSFFGVSSPTPFREVQFSTFGSNGDYFLLDDVRYAGPQIVPEPPAISLVALAIVGLLLSPQLRYRRSLLYQ
jgi:uncharacterized membrane protein